METATTRIPSRQLRKKFKHAVISKRAYKVKQTVGIQKVVIVTACTVIMDYWWLLERRGYFGEYI